MVKDWFKGKQYYFFFPFNYYFLYANYWLFLTIFEEPKITSFVLFLYKYVKVGIKSFSLMSQLFVLEEK